MDRMIDLNQLKPVQFSFTRVSRLIFAITVRLPLTVTLSSELPVMISGQPQDQTSNTGSSGPSGAGLKNFINHELKPLKSSLVTSESQPKFGDSLTQPPDFPQHWQVGVKNMEELGHVFTNSGQGIGIVLGVGPAERKYELGNHPPRFVYVDNNPSQQSVLRDLRDWWQLLLPGGVIAGGRIFHPQVLAAVKQFSNEIGIQPMLCAEPWPGEQPGGPGYLFIKKNDATYFDPVSQEEKRLPMDAYGEL